MHISNEQFTFHTAKGDFLKNAETNTEGERAAVIAAAPESATDSRHNAATMFSCRKIFIIIVM